MCELFGMSSRLPADVSVSLEKLADHGGHAGPHRDGWGLAYYSGKDAQIVREPSAASESACVRFIEEQRLASRCVVGHIRRATVGANTLANTQPFARELGGRMHVFAHNGELPGVFDDPRVGLGRFRPIGDTDSERAFCWLLARFEALGAGARVPSLAARLEIVVELARTLTELGPAANFLFGDGDALFAHAHRRQLAEGAEIMPPGLHLLCRSCRQETPLVDSAALQIRGGHEQRVVLLASVPLTDEPWEPLAEGEIVVLQHGRIAARAQPLRAGARTM